MAKPPSSNRRAITLREHQLIISTERNIERRLYYELLWDTGGSQTDVVMLTAENCDWKTRVLSFQRKKLNGDAPPAQLSIGPKMEAVLRQLSSAGPLFPKWCQTRDKDRSAEFRLRCNLLKINCIGFNSYRYAWAERAFAAGYPERFAMANLGHSSRAVHRSYAKKAFVICPPWNAFRSDNNRRLTNLQCSLKPAEQFDSGVSGSRGVADFAGRGRLTADNNFGINKRGVTSASNANHLLQRPYRRGARPGVAGRPQN